jgi:hypothetical protein
VVKELPADTTEWTDEGLAPGSVHRYTVRAEQGSDLSAPRRYTERTFDPFPVSGGRPTASFDVVVAQASSGGVAAAIEAGRRGCKVALIEPTTRLGGMPVNGLSATDLRRPANASGLLIRFRDRVKALYASEGVQTSGLEYEPRVAHQAMKSLLYEAPNITILRRARPVSVSTEDTGNGRRRVRSVIIEELDASGNPTGHRAELAAREFVDATDNGDLAAWAGAPFRTGREPRSKAEPHAGVIYYDRAHDVALPGSTGAGDKRVMSYAYLLTVKDYGPGVDKTIPPPPGYRKEDFIHSPAWRDSWAVTSGHMPGSKYELNQHPQGNDLQEINYGYPNAGYAERARVEKLYRDHILCYLYYIQTELGQKQIGLPDDEYRDSGGFPPLLYVRESRRIIGEQLPVEADITNARSYYRPESIGLGDYPMDSHAVEVKRDWDRPDMGEGEWWLYKQTPWHQLPYGVIVPRTLDNVFVTTAVSSTHVSNGTYRLEPVRMAFGQAAAIGAWLCMRYHLTPREVPARQIQDELTPRLEIKPWDRDTRLYAFTDVPPTTRHYHAIQYLAARGFVPVGDAFKPDAPTTRHELGTWLTRLTARSDAEVGPESAAQFATHKGNAAALLAGPDGPVTRREFADALRSVLPTVYWSPPTDGPHYADSAGLQAAEEGLFYQGLDSRLWDEERAYNAEGKILFHPESTISHADLFQTLYIAQLGLGPLFFDDAVDFTNGRVDPDRE